MRWIIYLVCTCAVIDLIILKNNIDNKVDVFAPGIYVFVLIFIVFYTIFFVLLIERREMFDRKLLLSIFILSPCLLYLIAHIFIVFANLVNVLN